jgi:hypothetical protein
MPFSAQVAQLVEHVLGKDGVVGSIPILGSIKILRAKFLEQLSEGNWQIRHAQLWSAAQFLVLEILR